MKTIMFELDQFNKGYFMAWTITTQTSVAARVELKAGGRTYFNVSHNADHAFHMLGQGHDTFGGEGNLILSITCATGCELKQSLTSGAITDAKAKKVGYVYSFCVEDGTDDDYNDVYVNIVAWNKEG